MEKEKFDSLVKAYFGKKRNYRFYSYFKKCIDKVVCSGNGAANLCRFIDSKCLINSNVANKSDIEYITKFCTENNIVIELVAIDFHRNNL